MSFSYTGLFDLFLLFAIGLFTLRFYRYWKEEKTYFSKLFLCFGTFFALWVFLTSIGGLFFSKNVLVLKGLWSVATFFQMTGFAFIGCLLVYLKLPKISPKFGFLIIFLLSLGVLAHTVLLPFNPYLEPSGSINWNVTPINGVLRFFIVIITVLPLGILLVQQGLASETRTARIKAFGMGGLLLAGLLVAPLDFFLSRLLGAMGADLATGILATILFLLILFTQKPKK